MNKIIKHPKQLHCWKENINHFPITAEINLTNICNYKCPDCIASYYNSQSGNKDILETNKVLELINELKECDIKGVLLSGGGEPLLHPNIKKIVKHILLSGIDLGIITNGSPLNNMSNQLRELIVASCSWIRFSIDAATNTTYKRVHWCGNNDYNNVISNIKELIRIKQLADYQCRIGYAFLTTDVNYHEIITAVETAILLGVDYISFRPAIMFGKVTNEIVEEHYHRNKVILEDIHAAIESHGKDVEIIYAKTKYEQAAGLKPWSWKECEAHNFQTVINAKGDVMLCCLLNAIPKRTFKMALNTFTLSL